MNKGLKIFLNLAIFLLVVVFFWYVILMTFSGGNAADSSGLVEPPFESAYAQAARFDLPDEIIRFELCDNKLFVLAGQSVHILDTEGNYVANFSVEPGARDITVDLDKIYLLYPSRVEAYSSDGRLFHQWEACSELSDYCSFTVGGGAVFVTDAENKNICKYTTEGYFVRFINSPNGFIIPSYSFDIAIWNDTIYCVNSGRHLVETYTFDGDYISSFGGFGTTAGSFAGCCNPSYISFTSCGMLVTSEKGNPRVCSFERSGKFAEQFLDGKMLGSGNKACEARTSDNKLFVAVKDRIVVFSHILQ